MGPTFSDHYLAECAVHWNGMLTTSVLKSQEQKTSSLLAAVLELLRSEMT